jgi:hypothetical protein
MRPWVLVGLEDGMVGRDSSVGVATRHGLNSPGIESRWEEDFPHASRPILGPTQHPTQRVKCLLPGVKRLGAWRWPPSLKKEQNYRSTALWAIMACSRVTFTFMKLRWAKFLWASFFFVLFFFFLWKVPLYYREANASETKLSPGTCSVAFSSDTAKHT